MWQCGSASASGGVKESQRQERMFLRRQAWWRVEAGPDLLLRADAKPCEQQCELKKFQVGDEWVDKLRAYVHEASCLNRYCQRSGPSWEGRRSALLWCMQPQQTKNAVQRRAGRNSRRSNEDRQQQQTVQKQQLSCLGGRFSVVDTDRTSKMK